MADLNELGFEDETDQLKSLGFEEETPPGSSAMPDETSVASTPYGPSPNHMRTPGVGESFVQGAANTFGTGDLMGAMLQAGMSEVQDIPELLRGDMSLDELRQRRNATFSDARAENLRLTREAMKEHPVATIAGRLIPGAMMAPATGLGNTLGLSGVSGALSGGIEGAASSDADTAGEVLADAATGSAAGGVGGVLGYGAGKYVLAPAGAWVGQKAGNALSRGASDIEDAFRRFAQERALKASGYIQKDFPREDPAALRRLLGRGQVLLDEPGLITTGASAGNINQRLEPLVEREGQRIGEYLDAADAAAGYGSGPFNPYAFAAEAKRASDAGLWRGGPFNPQMFADEARQSVAQPFTRNPSLTNEGQGVTRWLGRLTDTATEQAGEGVPFTFRQANQYKGDLQNAVFNPQGLPRANKQAQNELQRALTQAIDEQAEPLIGPAGVQGFRDARRQYGAFADALDKSQQQVNREVGNNFLRLNDMQAGQMAQEVKGLENLPYIGPAAALGSKLLRGRMDSTIARAADAVANSATLAALRNTSPEVLGGYGAAIGGVAGSAAGDWLSEFAQRSSEAQSPAQQSTSDFVGTAMRSNPELLGPYAPMVESAMAQGNLPILHYRLMQTDPAYREQLEQARKAMR